VEAAPAYLLSGSSLSSWWLRALGAKIGKEVIIGSMTLRAPDLLEIGDNVSVGNAVNFENARVQRGRLLLGRITLEQDACVSSFAVLEGNTRCGPRPSGRPVGTGRWPTVAAGRIWAGSPARDVGAFDSSLLPPVHTPAPCAAPAKRCSSCSAYC
jgi:non-ribosomal peptide synthetase-like protein